MANLEEMRDQASPEQNIKIYATLGAAGLAVTGLAEALYFENIDTSDIQYLAIGGLLLAGNYGFKLIREIRSLRHHRNQEDS
jgi:hypothetical protein